MALPKRPRRIEENPEGNEVSPEPIHGSGDFFDSDDSLISISPEDEVDEAVETANNTPSNEIEEDGPFDDGDVPETEVEESNDSIPTEAAEEQTSDGSDAEMGSLFDDGAQGTQVEAPAPITAAPSVKAQNRIDSYKQLVGSEIDDVVVDAFSLDNSGLSKRFSTFDGGDSASHKVEKKASRKAVRFGGISADFAVNGDYQKFAHLEPKIEKMVNEIQDTLSDQGESEKVGMARRDRGSELYNDMYVKIDRLIIRSLASNEGISVEPWEAEYFTAAVSNEILGFGPLEPLWADSTISEVMVNGPENIRVEVRGKKRKATGVRFRDMDHAMKVANNFLALSGRTFSTKMPYADASLPDGSRLNAIHPEIAPDGPYLTIRRFPDTIFSLQKLVELGSMDEDMAYQIGNMVRMGVSTVVAGGTGTGKALDVNTPIPTPAGMIRLGDLVVGDTVFDENGQPTKVTGFFPQPKGRKCYRVSFSDGSSVIADAEHNWFVNDGMVQTTEELFSGFMHNSYTVPLAEVVQYAEQDLPVDPYLLGFWLACGNANGHISDSQANVERILRERGIRHSRIVDKQGKISNNMIEVEGFAGKLAEIGLLTPANEETVLLLPEGYLIASEGQRRALLGGLMDNGSILHRKNGYIEFVLADNPALADQIVRLATSLGLFVKRHAMEYDGSQIVTLLLETDEDIFYCDNMRAEHEESRIPVERVKDITAIHPVDSVDVACISVDSENHLYLFGNEHTVTHNTSMLNALSGCIPDDERIITVEDTLELQLNPSKHVLSLRSRPANPKGEDAVTIRDLVRNTLRMAPDRIVVGEVRDASAYDMMQAMNTGHDGSLTTTHASNPIGTIERLALLTSEAGEVTPDRALSLIAGAVDLIVNIERFPEDGSRRVSTISEVPSGLEMEDGRLVLKPIVLWEWVRDGMDENGKLYGHYEKTNELSASLRRKHSLDSRKWIDIEELYRDSAVPERIKPEE